MAVTRKIQGDVLLLVDGDREVLKLEECCEDGRATVKLTGSMSSDTVYELQDELRGFAVLGLELSLDLSGVEYICPSCQELLLALQNTMETRGMKNLVLTKLSRYVQEEFERTGLSQMLMIEE